MTKSKSSGSSSKGFSVPWPSLSKKKPVCFAPEGDDGEDVDGLEFEAIGYSSGKSMPNMRLAEDMREGIEANKAVIDHLNHEVNDLTIKLQRALENNRALQTQLSSVGAKLKIERDESCQAHATGSQGTVSDSATSLSESLGKDQLGVMGDRGCISGDFDLADTALPGVTNQRSVNDIDVDLTSPQSWSGLRELREQGEHNGWLVDPAELEMGREIGLGSSAKVFRARWRGTDVACKCVNINSKSAISCFLREVRTLAKLRHPCIVPFLGACLQPPNRCWILCKYMEGGTLAEWLHKGAGRKASSKAKHNVLKDIAAAMQCLEDALPTVMHRDLKASNVYVDSAGHAHVADFGLSRCLPKPGETITGETGTYMYMAPEVIKHEPYNIKADVYSYAVLMCEILAGEEPYSGSFLTPIQIAMGVTQRNLRPTVPKKVHPSYMALMNSAWNSDPSARPSFGEIVRQLRAMEVENLDRNLSQSSFSNGHASTSDGILSFFGLGSIETTSPDRFPTHNWRSSERLS